MIFIVRVSDSERLSYSHKIFIDVKIFDSMKNVISIAAMLLMTCGAFAQQALWGGASVESPVVNEDGTVTFRYQAPKAVKVTVSGDFLPTQKITFNMGS